MRRRSFLFVVIVSLTAVGWNVVTTRPSGSALAADPQAELAKTREQLADARSTQQSLAAALRQQRAELDHLRARVWASPAWGSAARAEPLGRVVTTFHPTAVRDTMTTKRKDRRLIER